jgi:LemA protein
MRGLSTFRRPTWAVPWVVAVLAVAVLWFGGTWTKAEGVAYPRITLLVTAALLYLFALRLRLREWEVKDTPTSGCGGVTVGTCEVIGRAGATPQIAGRASNVPCAWYRWELQHYVHSGKNSHWETVERERTTAPFTVTDTSGAATVFPANAEMMGFKDHKYDAPGHGHGKWRQLEWRLEVGHPVYVLGPVSFDGDGVAFRCDDPGDEFIISADTERQVERKLSVAATAATLLGLGAALLAFVLYAHQGFDDKGKPTVFYGTTHPARDLGVTIAAVLVLYALALFAGWLVRAFNRLVRVRVQAEKAWASIAVEVKRRHDLIDQLVTIVRAYTTYERTTLQQLTDDRSLPDTSRLHATADADATTQADHQALVALAEQYPQLHANESFEQLAHELTRTENRVALARGFYNDAITVLRDRRGTFPYVFIAPFVTTPSYELYSPAPAADVDANASTAPASGPPVSTHS